MDELERLSERWRQATLTKIFCRILLAGKKIIVFGEENFVREGPNVIIGNHPGAYRDVITVLLTIPRPFFFNANKDLFYRERINALVRKHLRRHLGRFGLLVNFLINPFKFLFADYVAPKLAAVGTIPVDLTSHDKREAIHKVQEYLKLGRLLISLQGRGRIDASEPNPYMKPFGRGISIAAYNLRVEDRMDVPITPIALFGTQRPWGVPGRILVNVGSPMFVRDYMTGGFEESVAAFRDALQSRVHCLILDLIKHWKE